MNETNPSQAQDLAKSILVNEEETNQTAVEEEPAIETSVDEDGTEWWEDDDGTWWYRMAGEEEWQEYSE